MRDNQKMNTLKFDQKITMQEIIIEHDQVCNSFVDYLSSIHAVEALEFWIEVGIIIIYQNDHFSLIFVINNYYLELFKRIAEPEEINKVAKLIFTTYLSPHSPKEINLEVFIINNY